MFIDFGRDDGRDALLGEEPLMVDLLADDPLKFSLIITYFLVDCALFGLFCLSTYLGIEELLILSIILISS